MHRSAASLAFALLVACSGPSKETGSDIDADIDADTDADADSDSDTDSGDSCETVWHVDADRDGFGADDEGVVSCDDPTTSDTTYVTSSSDCDDLDPDINPAATEACDPLDRDEDCNGASDDADSAATGKTTWVPDADADGFFDAFAAGVVACDPPGDDWSAEPGDDCDDADPDVHPGAIEHCDGVDEDCDGDIDEDAADATAWHADADEDGFGAAKATMRCEPEIGDTLDDSDCDDLDAEVFPGADEWCNGDDDDCDGVVDEDALDPTAWYTDADGDGYGASDAVAVWACDNPGGAADNADDCDDAMFIRNPGQDEICDDADVDEDCDGLADSDDPSVDTSTYALWYPDADGDGYGSADDAGTLACDPPSAGTVTTGGDCDDADAEVFPGRVDHCDGGKDDDCDPSTSDAQVRFTDPSGNETDVSADFAKGTSTSPYDPTWKTGEGTYDFCDGTYYVEVYWSSFPMTFEGEGADAGDVVLASGFPHSPVLSGSDLTVRHLTVSGAWNPSSYGGGIYCNHGTLTVEDAIVEGNEARDGGGIAVLWCDATITDSILRDNLGSWGSALHVYDGSNVTISGTLIEGNIADESAAVWVEGGYTTPTSVDFVDTVITGNDGKYVGGVAIYAYSAATMTGGGVTANTASCTGCAGGVMISLASAASPTFDTDVTDFGEDASSDDNDPYDISIMTTITVKDVWDYGDDASVSCTKSACSP